MLRHLRRALPAAALVLPLAVMPAVASDPTNSHAQTTQPGIRGSFSMQQMFHTASAQFGVLPNVRPWDGRSRSSTSFVYRGIPCTGQAPVNNIATNLATYNNRIRGSRSPASTRFHPFAFKVQRTRRGTEMIGRITMTVCQLRNGPTPNPDPVPDERKPKIRFAFRAEFKRQNVEEVRFAGTFRILGGTQRYNDLSGSGRLSGYLFCFALQGCTANGSRFSDGQISMQGRYADPTPELSAG